MIFFNIESLPAVALSLIVYWVLNKFWPGLFNSSYGDYLLSFNVFICGLATELLGLKGRIFFIPVWACGLLYGYFHLTAPLKGWAWLPLIGAVGFFFVWFELRFRKQQREAPERLRLARIKFELGKTDEMWALLTESFLTSGYYISKAVGSHDREMLGFLRTYLGARLTERQRSYIEGYIGHLELAARNDYRAIKFEQKLESFMKEFLKSKGTLDPPDEILALACAPPVMTTQVRT